MTDQDFEIWMHENAERQLAEPFEEDLWARSMSWQPLYEMVTRRSIALNNLLKRLWRIYEQLPYSNRNTKNNQENEEEIANSIMVLNRMTLKADSTGRKELQGVYVRVVPSPVLI